MFRIPTKHLPCQNRNILHPVPSLLREERGRGCWGRGSTVAKPLRCTADAPLRGGGFRARGREGENRPRIMGERPELNQEIRKKIEYNGRVYPFRVVRAATALQR